MTQLTCPLRSQLGEEGFLPRDCKHKLMEPEAGWGHKETQHHHDMSEQCLHALNPRSRGIGPAECLHSPFLMVSLKVQVSQSFPTLCDPIGQNTGVGSFSLLQGIFSTQGLNPGLPHCKRILYQLSHKGSPRILECVKLPALFYSLMASHRIAQS